MEERRLSGWDATCPNTYAQSYVQSSSRHTIRSAPALLRKGSAWKDYAKSEVPLLPVLKKLAMR